MKKRGLSVILSVILLIVACWGTGAICWDNGYGSGKAAGINQVNTSSYDKGFSEGKEKGITEGKQDGHDSGLEEGKKAGYDSGLAAGKDAGYSSGYAAGVAAGKKSVTQTSSKTSSSTHSSSAARHTATTTSVTVYITRTGSKYHRDGCSYLRQSKIPISLSEAKAEGYDACSRCNPPG